MLFEDKIITLINLLEEGKAVLIPSQSHWYIAIAFDNPILFPSMLQQEEISQYITILTKNLLQLRLFIPHLHPRVETMLTYYERPFGLISNNNKKLPPWAESYVHNKVIYTIPDIDFTRTLIDLLGKPLILFKSIEDQNDPLPFAKLDNRFIDLADYSCKHRRGEESSLPTTYFSWNSEGDLVFYDASLNDIR